VFISLSPVVYSVCMHIVYVVAVRFHLSSSIFLPSWWNNVSLRIPSGQDQGQGHELLSVIFTLFLLHSTLFILSLSAVVDIIMASTSKRPIQHFPRLSSKDNWAFGRWSNFCPYLFITRGTAIAEGSPHQRTIDLIIWPRKRITARLHAASMKTSLLQ